MKCHQNGHMFQIPEAAQILVQALFHGRDQNAYLLHEFFAMPDHFQKSNSAGITVTSSAEALLASTAGPGLKRRPPREAPKEAPEEQELKVNSDKIMRNSTCGKGSLR
jgi:hypothetical protein